MRPTLLISFTALLILFLAPAIAGSQTGKSYTQLDYPGATSTTANDINDNGEIVGNWIDKHNRNHIFVLSNGVYRTVALPKWASDSLAAGLNNTGDIVGSYTGKDGITRGFILKRGVCKSFDWPHRDIHDLLQPEAINDKDEVVGSYIGSDDGAFLFRNGKFTVLKPPRAVGMSTEAHGINNQGEIVGQYSDTQGRIHAFLLNNERYKSVDLGDPASSVTIPEKITDGGTILGEYYNKDGSDAAYDFVISHGARLLFRRIDNPIAQGINDSSEIVGIYADNQSKRHGFLMSVSIPKDGKSMKVSTQSYPVGQQ